MGAAVSALAVLSFSNSSFAASTTDDCSCLAQDMEIQTEVVQDARSYVFEAEEMMGQSTDLVEEMVVLTEVMAQLDAEREELYEILDGLGTNDVLFARIVELEAERDAIKATVVEVRSDITYLRTNITESVESLQIEERILFNLQDRFMQCMGE